MTPDNIPDMTGEQMEQYLGFANDFCGISVTGHGAIASYPTMEEMKKRKQTM